MYNENFPWLSAIILAGGSGSRMGREKCSILLNGKSLLDHTIDLLTRFSEDLIISSNILPEIYGTYPVFKDEIKDAGPIAGIATVLGKVKNKAAILLPCDTPLIPAEAITFLINHFQDRITAFSIKDRVQPLCAVYPVALSGYFISALQNGEYKLLTILRQLNADIYDLESSIPGINTELFININTPDKIEKANAILKKLA